MSDALLREPFTNRPIPPPTDYDVAVFERPVVRRSHRPGSIVARIAALTPGQSEFFPGKTTTGMCGFIAYVRRRAGGGLWMSRTFTVDGVQGVRVWRVAGSAEQ